MGHHVTTEAKGARAPSPPPRPPPVPMGVRPEVEEIARLCRELDSIVLSDEGRVAERKELESILAQIGDDPSLSDGERAIIADARSVLAREQASPSMWWSPSASPAVPAPRPSVEAPTRDEQLKKVSPLVRQTVEDVDDEASGKVLFADALSNRGREGLKRWALELQSIPNTPKGNYLHAWYLLLYDAYPESALKLGQIIADMGIEFGGNVSGFTNLEHLDPKEKLPPTMAPEVEKLPLSHGIDNFTSVQYDLTYRAHGGVLSNYLQLTYADGVTIDLDIHTISDDDDPAPFQAIAYSYVGAGGRVFPLRLDPDTTPRLVKAKHWAVGIMEKDFEDFEFFVSLSLAGVMSTLPIGPVTIEDPVPVGPGPRPTQRDVPAPAPGEGAAAKTPDVAPTPNAPDVAPAPKAAQTDAPATTTTDTQAGGAQPPPTTSNVFDHTAEFTPSTGRTYKVFQRKDIDWNQIRTAGDKRYIGKTNAQAAREAGLPPQLPDGNFATLHHSQQSAQGPWFEASTSYHNIRNAKQPPLHPYRGLQHPDFPLGRGPGSLRDDFQRVESPEYWKWREQNRNQ